MKKTRILLMILTLNLITLFSGLKAYRAWLHTTESRIKVNRSAVRAPESTTQTTPPLSPWAPPVTASGLAVPDSLCVGNLVHWWSLASRFPDTLVQPSPEMKPFKSAATCEHCGVSKWFELTPVPAAAPTTSTYPSVASPLFAVPAQGGATYSSMPSNSTVPLPPRDEDVLP